MVNFLSSNKGLSSKLVYTKNQLVTWPDSRDQSSWSERIPTNSIVSIEKRNKERKIDPFLNYESSILIYSLPMFFVHELNVPYVTCRENWGQVNEFNLPVLEKVFWCSIVLLVFSTYSKKPIVAVIFLAFYNHITHD